MPHLNQNSMTITYKRIEIPGHASRVCPICSTCKRVCHPKQLPSGTVGSGDGDSWTCSIYCTFILKHGHGGVALLNGGARSTINKGNKQRSPEPAAAAVDLLEKYKAVPGASWADDEE